MLRTITTEGGLLREKTCILCRKTDYWRLGRITRLKKMIERLTKIYNQLGLPELKKVDQSSYSVSAEQKIEGRVWAAKDASTKPNTVIGTSKTEAAQEIRPAWPPEPLMLIVSLKQKTQKKHEREETGGFSVSVSLSPPLARNNFLSMTGSKPVRRPKKKAKQLQKEFVNLFLGMWLCSITDSSYRLY